MTNDNSQAHLDMVFDGPALADGSMNVRDLAPAMMAVGSFFEAANRITNGERTSVSVNVRATSAGSFQVFFEVVQNLEAVDVLRADIGDFLTTANALKALLIGGGGLASGIFALIKWLRGRKPHLTKINESLYRRRRDLQSSHRATAPLSGRGCPPQHSRHGETSQRARYRPLHAT